MLLPSLSKFIVGITVIGGLSSFLIIYTSSVSGGSGSVHKSRFYSDHFHHLSNIWNTGKVGILKKQLQNIVNKEAYIHHTNDNATEPSVTKNETTPAIVHEKNSTLPLCSERGESLGNVLYCLQLLRSSLLESS